MKKLALITATTALTVGIAAPAANADVIDTYLAKIPSGQISCEQVYKYYTNASDYNTKKQQALAVAAFDSRGAQIRDAISRMDEAIARCGTGATGTTGTTGTAATPATNANANTTNQTPAHTPAAANGKQVIPVFNQPGVPTTDVEVPGTNYVVRVPNVQELIQAAIAQVQAQVGSLSSR